MSFDGLFTRAITHELSSLLKGGRINKIHQPYKNEIILAVRANGVNHKLLLSAHPSYARVQITNEQYDNPNEPPMFCMLLRKHLEGFIIEDIKQAGLDRMIIFEVKGRNEIGDISYKQLIVEIMGRHSNIIIVDKNRNVILDSIKHISFAVNSHRAIMPGQEYIMPPQQEKLNPLEAGEEDVLRVVDFNAGKIDKQLVANFAGVSPVLAKEITFKAGLVNRTTLPKAFAAMMEEIKNHHYKPAVTYGSNKEAFYLLPFEHLQGETKSFETLSQLLDRFYFGKAERDRVKQQGNDLERLLANEKEKNEKKIKKLEATLEDAKKAEQFQLYGELLTANIFMAQKGMQEISVVNYYDENGASINIPLDPRKTPSENAQKYFTKYQKAKNSVNIVKEQIQLAQEEVAYFESLLQQVEAASPKDIEEIREELIEGGYIRARQKKGNKNKQNLKPVLEKYHSTDGTEILVGKNNKQNDYLTNKVAARDEIWLHTKDIPGSHVVIRSKEPSEDVILEAAQIAAYFSKARNSSSVPVDFTRVRHVKKPAGAKPGFVIYEQQQTVYITPDEDVILKLKQ
ncbi:MULTISPECIES: NFACT RNA binding domain-containing protein [unclassified Mesobacillus]|jgi:predicted ribosome quality control (RQC) complex YloA/Tae2 family protein|uniref:Rqc2 family fibronectin-binding protein n=1 Tax=unclassified Mesobacillus TaxID=2675270 RepID=UPI00203D1792|nr:MULTISPECIES: NFACT RNA binding domain-containing protein [unclassified Mesobacillus]MCM3123370.1 NFACT family protein [Mesobacillus sp. MER 33]MCM3233147.1 NFACT family protein [Mesobacillus sp. MER 48]